MNELLSIKPNFGKGGLVAVPVNGQSFIDKLEPDEMEVEVSVFKHSGKWYTSEVYKDKDILLSSDEFKNWLRDHLPAKCGPGSYYVVRSTDREKQLNKFHNALYTYKELFNE